MNRIDIYYKIMILYGFGFFCLGAVLDNMILLGFGIGIFSSYLGELISKYWFKEKVKESD